MSNRVFITAKEVAAIRGIGTGAVYDRAAPRGPLTCYRFGGILRFDPADVDAYMQSCRCEPIDLVKIAGQAQLSRPTITLKASDPNEPSGLKAFFLRNGIDVDKVNERRLAKQAKLDKQKKPASCSSPTQ